MQNRYKINKFYYYKNSEQIINVIIINVNAMYNFYSKKYK